MTNKFFRIVLSLSMLCLMLDVSCAEEDDDIMSFDDKKPIPINAPTTGSKKPDSSASKNPYNGIQELSNQFKDGNFQNLKKMTDSNANVLMSVFGLGSNWISTNLRLASAWNDLNRDLAEKTIKAIYKINENNLRFLKASVVNTNSGMKSNLDLAFQNIQKLRDTFNNNGQDESANSLSLVSKSGRPLETMKEITDELPSGVVSAASSWLGR